MSQVITRIAQNCISIFRIERIIPRFLYWNYFNLVAVGEKAQGAFMISKHSMHFANLCCGYGLPRHHAACYTTTQKPPLRGTGSESRCARVFTGPGFRVSSDGPSTCETCYNTASGCPCFGLRATPFVFLETACQLLTAVFVRTRALAPCYGHGLDHQRRQARQRSDKPHHLDNQVHGQLTSSLRERRCQHTGLIPLTSSNYTIKSNIRSLFPHVDSDRKVA